MGRLWSDDKRRHASVGVMLALRAAARRLTASRRSRMLLTLVVAAVLFGARDASLDLGRRGGRPGRALVRAADRPGRIRDRAHRRSPRRECRAEPVRGPVRGARYDLTGGPCCPVPCCSSCSGVLRAPTPSGAAGRAASCARPSPGIAICSGACRRSCTRPSTARTGAGCTSALESNRRSAIRQTNGWPTRAVVLAHASRGPRPRDGRGGAQQRNGRAAVLANTG